MDEITIHITEETEEVTIYTSEIAAVPPGGSAGQLLSKKSGNDFSVMWIDPPIISLAENQIAFGNSEGVMSGSPRFTFQEASGLANFNVVADNGNYVQMAAFSGYGNIRSNAIRLWSYTAGSSGIIQIIGENYISFWTGTDGSQPEHMRLDNSGNLRLGHTNTATAKFDVRRTSIGASIYAANNSYNQGGFGPVTISDGSGLTFSLGYSEIATACLYVPGGGGIYFRGFGVYGTYFEVGNVTIPNKLLVGSAGYEGDENGTLSGVKFEVNGAARIAGGLQLTTGPTAEIEFVGATGHTANIACSQPGTPMTIGVNGSSIYFTTNNFSSYLLTLDGNDVLIGHTNASKARLDVRRSTIGASAYFENNSYNSTGDGPVMVYDGYVGGDKLSLGYSSTADYNIRAWAKSLVFEYNDLTNQTTRQAYFLGIAVRLGRSATSIGASDYDLEVIGNARISSLAGGGDRQVRVDDNGVLYAV